MKCFLCGTSDLKKKYTLARKTIYACPHDGIYYAKPQGSKKTASLYSTEYYDANPHGDKGNLSRNYFQSKLTTIQRLTHTKTPSVLDVGCGWGDFIGVLHSHNIPYLGIDISRASIDLCKSKGYTCENISIEALAKKRTTRFDAVVSFQTIEHLHDPLPFLTAARSLLKPGGILVATTPNNDTPLRKIAGERWSVYNTDSHFVFYEKNNLAQTFEKAGFKNVRVTMDTVRFFSLSYILSRLGFASSTPHFVEKLLHIPLPTDPWGDLEVVGRKS